MKFVAVVCEFRRCVLNIPVNWVSPNTYFGTPLFTLSRAHPLRPPGYFTMQRIDESFFVCISPMPPPSPASPRRCSRKKDSKPKSPEDSPHHGASCRALSIVQDRRRKLFDQDQLPPRSTFFRRPLGQHRWAPPSLWSWSLDFDTMAYFWQSVWTSTGRSEPLDLS
jgi:hypothetical protein